MPTPDSRNLCSFCELLLTQAFGLSFTLSVERRSAAVIAGGWQAMKQNETQQGITGERLSIEFLEEFPRPRSKLGHGNAEGTAINRRG